jgi:hypothetical protein
MKPLPADFESKAHALQDAFALDVCGEGGRWLEIGACAPLDMGSNTALLELYKWTGISLEIDPAFLPKWKESWRDDSVLRIADATKFDFASLENKRFNYIQLDVEPPSVTFECLKHILESGIAADCITFEHDLYANPLAHGVYKERAYDLLKEYGYRRAIEGVLRIDMPHVDFEDWYVRDDNPFPTQNFADWAKTAFCKYSKPGRPLLIP